VNSRYFQMTTVVRFDCRIERSQFFHVAGH
jgi:hypothetical protein